jgi:hypothetical protein
MTPNLSKHTSNAQKHPAFQNIFWWLYFLITNNKWKEWEINEMQRKGASCGKLMWLGREGKALKGKGTKDEGGKGRTKRGKGSRKE